MAGEQGGVMWGNSKRFLVALLLALLLSPPLSSEAVYEITETELTALESILSRQEQTIAQLKEELTLSDSISQQLQNTLQTQETTIEMLRTSSQEYERAVLRSSLVWGSVGFIAGMITHGIIGLIK